MTTDWDPVAAFLLAAMGYRISANKYYLLDAALMPIMRNHALKTPMELVRAAQADRAVLQAVINACTINESYFFRDPTMWNALMERVIPALVPEVAYCKRLHILQCASSRGQELYTLQMALAEHKEALQGTEVRIVATDIDTEMLDYARAGTYSELEIGRGLSPERRERHFEERGGRWHARPHLRTGITFQALNLNSDFRFMQRFDLILCRNVLIYFSAEGKAAILDRLAQYTNNYGKLVLGGAENVHGLSESWTPRCAAGATFFDKRY